MYNKIELTPSTVKTLSQTQMTVSPNETSGVCVSLSLYYVQKFKLGLLCN